ncbi:MAG: CPBP family intramembrane metalloprotease [Candidatus Brocadiaceae bacterium]|nr:CPBP family intramembrane metalloprotease [Candidatus Brocadiaceae bacterium]
MEEVQTLFSHSQLFDIIIISGLAGFAEELFFRGILQVKLGIIWASIIFGLLHFVTPAYGIVAIVMGLYIGILFHYTQSLLVPVQLHFIYDFAALVYLKYFVRT